MRLFAVAVLAFVIGFDSSAFADDHGVTCEDLKGIPSLYKLCNPKSAAAEPPTCYRERVTITKADEIETRPGVYSKVVTCKAGGVVTGGGFNLGDARAILVSQPHASSGAITGWECEVAGLQRKSPQCYVMCCR